mgnify:FL=1
MKKRKNIITIAIDSPAAAGAGTVAKRLAQHYKLFYLDTGKLYRLIGKMRIRNKNTSYRMIKYKIKNLKITDLNKIELLNHKVAASASIVARDNNIRNIVKNFQKVCAYNPPKNFDGSILDGRDITSVIMKDAMFKFYITANLKVRAKRRFMEFKKLKKKISYNQVLKSLKKRDNLDKNRKHSPLKRTEDSILINTSKLSKKACFFKIKEIIDKKLNINGNI